MCIYNTLWLNSSDNSKCNGPWADTRGLRPTRLHKMADLSFFLRLQLWVESGRLSNQWGHSSLSTHAVHGRTGSYIFIYSIYSSLWEFKHIKSKAWKECINGIAFHTIKECDLYGMWKDTTFSALLSSCSHYKFDSGVCWTFHVLSESYCCLCVHLIEFHQTTASFSSGQVHSQDVLIFVDHFVDGEKFPRFDI